MQFQRGNNQDKARKKNRINKFLMQDNTPDQPEGEVLYNEDNVNNMLSPMPDYQDMSGGREYPPNNVPQQQPMSVYQTAKNDFNNKSNDNQNLPSLVVTLPRNGEDQYERSPKTINLGSSGEEPEYNIRTLNAKKSPKNTGTVPNNYRSHRERESSEPNQEPIQYYDDDFQGYADGTGDSQPINPGGVMFPRSRSPPPYNQGRDISPYGNQTYEVPYNKLSPGKYYEDTNSSRERPQDPRYYDSRNANTNSNNMYTDGSSGYPRGGVVDTRPRQQQPLYTSQQAFPSIPNKSNTNPQQDEILNKYNDKTYNTSYRDVKKIAGRFAKIYDPYRNENGILLGENQVTVPGASDEVFNNRFRVLSKMNRLSNILLAKQRRSPSKKRYDDYGTHTGPGRDNSYNENSRKTFNRRTMGDSLENKKKRNVSRSPDHKFLYVSLAMISSKGPSCEDRTILRRMRLEKGGVVDLAQEDKKKNKFKIKKASPKKGGTRGYSYANPKFREKAAKIIQDWWRDLKVLYNDRLKKIILIQSVWRGKFVRKYMYDLFYLNFLYISFCKKIESVLSKHVRPEVFEKLMNREPKEEPEPEEKEEVKEEEVPPEEDNKDNEKKRLLKRIVKKDYRNNKTSLLPAWKKWLEEVRKNNLKNSKGRNLVQIRADKEKKQTDLKNAFDKWRYITEMLKTQEQTEENKKKIKELADNKVDEMDKIKGLFKILDGVDKLTKKDALTNTVPKIENYLQNLNEKGKLKKIVDKKPDRDRSLLRRYLYIWYANSLLDKDESILNQQKDDSLYKELRQRVFLNKVDNFEKKRDRNTLRKYFNRFFRKSVQLALEEQRRKSFLKEQGDKDKEDELEKNYQKQLDEAKNIKDNDEDELSRLRSVLEKIQKTEIVEETEIITKFQPSDKILQQLEACKILQRAVWRITHKDPLNAFGDKLSWEKLIVLLRKAVLNKGKTDQDLLRRAFDKWRKKAFKLNKDYLNKLFARFVSLTATEYARNILKKKFYQWRRNIMEPTEEKSPWDNLKTAKNIYDLMELIKKIYIDHYGDEFLKKLKKYRNPENLKKPLRSLVNKKDKNNLILLRKYFNKWKYLSKDEKIIKLIQQILYRIYCKYDNKNWELLNKYFQRWKKKTFDDQMMKMSKIFKRQLQTTITSRNTYMKNLINELDAEDDKDILQKYFNKWKSMVEKPPIYANLDEDKKAIMLRKLVGTRKKDEDMNLLEYLLRWKNKVNEMKRKEIPIPYRKQMIKILCTKNDKELLRKYFDRWRYSGLMRIPIMCYIVGVRLLRRALIRDTFKRFRKKMHETDPRVLEPKGQKLIDVLEDIAIYRPFKDFLKKLDKYGKIKTLEKVIPPVDEKVRKYYLDKYFKRWAENTLGDRNRKFGTFIEWIIEMRKESELWRKVRRNRKNEILKALIICSDKRKFFALQSAFRKYAKNVKLDEQEENAKIIQNFCRKKLDLILRRQKEARDKLAALFLRLYLKYILRSLLEAANKYRDYEEEKKKHVFKDYSKLRIAIRKEEGKRLEDLLRKYFDKWRGYYNFCNEEAILLQKKIRQYLARKRYDTIKKFYDFLLNSYLNKTANEKDLLRSKFHQWLLNKKKIDVDENARIIQDFCRKRLQRYLINKFINWFMLLAKKYTYHMIDNNAKVDKLNKALRRHPLQTGLDRLKKYIYFLLIRKILLKVLANYDDDMRRLLLKYYVDLWRKKCNEMKRKEEDAALEIERRFRGYLARKKNNMIVYRLQKLLYLFNKINQDPNDFVLASLRKWRKTCRREECEDNAKIIQDFCRMILEKIDEAKNERLKKLYIEIVEIIMKIKVDPSEFFERLKLIRRNQILQEFVDMLERKRKEHLRWVLFKLSKMPKSKYLIRIWHYTEDWKKRVLKEYFDRWKERAFRYKMIQEILKSIVYTIDNKKELLQGQGLSKWLYHAMYRKQDEQARIIQDFCRDILSKIRAKRNWKRLAELLLRRKGHQDLDDIFKKLRYLYGLEKLKEPIIHHVRKDVLDLLRMYYLYKLFILRMKKCIIEVDEGHNMVLLKKYWEIWKRKADLLKQREEGMADLCDILEKLRRKKATPNVEYASIIKNLFNLLPWIKALCCLRRIREYAYRNGNNNALANDLVRAQNEIKPQNEEKLIKKLIKVYAYKVLSKLFDTLDEVRYRKALPFMQELLKKLYLNKLKNSELNYIGQKESEGAPQNTKTSFRLRKKQPEKYDKKKLTYVTLTPYLVKYLQDILDRGKQDGFDALKRLLDDNLFCDLYKRWTEQQLLQPKRDLVDNLKGTADRLLSEGPLKARLYELLRHYAIRRILEDSDEIRRLIELKYLVKLVFMSKKIARQRWIRNLIRRWRYITFSRKLAANKMKRIYKNLHTSYLEMANCLFGEEAKGGAAGTSVIKEFERLGTDIGIWGNEEPREKEEEKFCKEIRNEYVFKGGDFEKYASKYYPGEEYMEEEKKEYVKVETGYALKGKKKPIETETRYVKKGYKK